MAYPQGINFRATVGFVTDGANDSFEGSITANYPRTTAQGNNVGWEQAISSTRDRQSGNDPRIAGLSFINPTQAEFRFDLPATGNHQVRLGAGDGNYGQAEDIDLYDTTTSLGSLCAGTTSAANTFKDAVNVQYSAANWPGSNTLVTKTFATTICRFRMKNNGGVNVISHAYVQVAPASDTQEWLNRGRDQKRTRVLNIAY